MSTVPVGVSRFISGQRKGGSVKRAKTNTTICLFLAVQKTRRWWAPKNLWFLTLTVPYITVRAGSSKISSTFQKM